jgi:ribosomal protein S18 acetylase RimI-like enzyme
MASEGLALKVWEAVAKPNQVVTECGRARAMQPDGAFSYRNGSIATVDGAVAGGLIGYVLKANHDASVRMPDAADAAHLPAFIRSLIELEQLAAEHWYINVLATYPEYRRSGVGAALLAHAEAAGRKVMAKGVALTVDADNSMALSVYVRAGYVERGRRPLLPFAKRPDGGEWLLMAKSFD